MKIEFSAIGYVQNGVAEKKDVSWSSEISRIVIDPIYEKGLLGLDAFSHIIVVYYLHEAKFDMQKDLIRRPRGREDMPMTGIFAQRAKDRPNPVGITTVELVQVSGNVVTVQGLDAINETPVIDIKPYFPEFDRKDITKAPEWARKLMEGYF